MHKGGKLSEEHKRKISKACKGGNSTSFKKGIIPWSKLHPKLMPRGKNNSSWKGGRVTDKDGYVYILKHNHPFCNKSGYILEHRLIMEKHLGRYLKPEEVVHHRNNNHSDNRLSNLKLCKNKSEHCKLHPENGMKTRFKKGNTRGFQKGHRTNVGRISLKKGTRLSKKTKEKISQSLKKYHNFKHNN